MLFKKGLIKIKKISLDGIWNLFFSPEYGDSPESIEEVRKRGWQKVDAVVPGNVEIDLCRAGIEQDPYFGENIYLYRKYEFYQWWFEREFDVPQDFNLEHVDLVLHGIDTYGTIWVNGIKVTDTSNMLIEHVIDITKVIKAGEKNHIAIRIKSAVNIARNMNYPVNLKGCEGIDEMVQIRKAPHSFGWDIAPRLLSAGIWRSIEIVSKENTYIKELYYATLWVKEGKAALIVKYRFFTDAVYLDGFSVRINGVCNDSNFHKEQKTKFCSDECTIVIDNPELWWPKGYGPQNLYKVTFELLHEGRVVDSRCEMIGIREVDIQARYISGDDGEFKIVVNGMPIIAKGTNWVPLDSLHSRDKSRLKAAHDMMEDLGCNIVRCWGGNVYEDHEFFDLCDERGMLVWQDFSLACGIYPQDDEFANLIRTEAEAVVRKLRNHPSLLLWAGDNEVDGMYEWFGYRLPYARYNRISREILPWVVGSHDPFRPFIPSSPYIPDDMTGDLNVPEQHNWGPRDYFKGDFYKHSSAHFISEIGYHGCPAVSSIRRFISKDKMWPYTDNDEWDTHNTDYIKTQKRFYNRNELMADQVKILFGSIPDNLEEFALASQISQAEAKKFFIESVRIKKWRKTGIIWWNMLDCWPQFSDAVVDYFFTKKIAYYFIKRVQETICVSMSELENRKHRVVICNDGSRDEMVYFTVEDGDTGQCLLSGEAFSKGNVNLDVGVIQSSSEVQKFYILRWNINGQAFANHFISGYPPFDFNRFKQWLKKIEALPLSFKSEDCYL